MKLLVTGGAGFIGGNFIGYWLKHHPEDQIVCLDKLTYAGHLSTVLSAFRSPAFRFVKGDIADGEGVERLFAREKFSLVVNFAAESHVDRSILDPRVFTVTNVLGAQTLMDACLKYGCRFHQVSTDEVYGDLPLTRKDLSFTESSPLRPSGPYSASKAAADLLALAYFRTYGLPVTVTRSSNNYGAYQYPEKLIPLAIAKALRGQPVPVYGDGSNVRDWLFAEDHCRAIEAVLQRGKAGNVYNAGAGEEHSNLEVVRAILKELGKDEGKIVFTEDRKGHDLRYSLDCTKITGECGWRPRKGFREGLAETVRWYLENRAWWEPFVQSGTAQK